MLFLAVFLLSVVAVAEVVVVKSIAYLFEFSFVGLDISEKLVRELGVNLSNIHTYATVKTCDDFHAT